MVQSFHKCCDKPQKRGEVQIGTLLVQGARDPRISRTASVTGDSGTLPIVFSDGATSRIAGRARRVCLFKSSGRRGEPRDPPANALKGWSRADERRSRAVLGVAHRAICVTVSPVPDAERSANTDTESAPHARARSQQQRHARGLHVGRHEHAQLRRHAPR